MKELEKQAKDVLKDKKKVEQAGDAVEEAIALIKTTGAIDKAKEKALSILDESRKSIMSSYPAGPVLEEISALFASFLKSFKGENR